MLFFLLLYVLPLAVVLLFCAFCSTIVNDYDLEGKQTLVITSFLALIPVVNLFLAGIIIFAFISKPK